MLPDECRGKVQKAIAENTRYRHGVSRYLLQAVGCDSGGLYSIVSLLVLDVGEDAHGNVFKQSFTF